jgi:single-stranded-DNA-specific exonuclease
MKPKWQIAPRVPEHHLARFPQLSSFIARLLRERGIAVPQEDPSARLRQLSSLAVQLLYNRGVTSPQDVQDFLTGVRPEDNPFRLKGMSEAVTRLRQAIRQGERIAIYGDFDADGVAATALLVETLSALGAKVKPYIPHRVDEGYGLHAEALRQLASQDIKVVVTVDCGIRSIKEVIYGKKLGLDLIITDHHSVGREVPPALAVINPKQADCRYPFKDLAGVGVAFKLAQALLRANRQVPVGKGEAGVNEEGLLDLVALGTVTDLAPLLGENRALVKQGLERLNDPQRRGIKALLTRAGLKPGGIDATAISFILGPRLNAAGRIDNAMISYNLLTARADEEAGELASRLEELNQQRQQLTVETLERAREQVLATAEREKLLFAIGEDFLAGIVGLVAHRLTEEFYRPSVVVELGAVESRGSARSISEFNITAALDQCSDLLIRYGGHAAAAGFTVANDNLEALQERLKELATEQLEGVELTPTLFIDAEVQLSEVDWATHAVLTQLEPCGYANPSPLLLSRRAIVRDACPVGPDERHLKLTLSDGRAVWDAIAFRQGHWAQRLPQYIDVVYSLEVQERADGQRLQLNVKDLQPST